jgi:sugar phosphate isomerase/epimerase
MSGRWLPGLCSVTFRALPVDEVIRLSVEAGLNGIEWGGDIHVPPGDNAVARRVGEASRRAGLTVASYGSYVSPPSDDMADFETVLHTAAALGAPNIRLWPGTRRRASSAYTPDERQRVVELLIAFAQRAAQEGITVALECHPGSLTDSLASARQLMTEAADDNLFFYWQPAPGQPLTEALEEIPVYAARLLHLHVFAWDAQSRRYPLETAADYWRAVLGRLEDLSPALPETGPRYALLEFVENDAPDAFRADARELHRILRCPGSD